MWLLTTFTIKYIDKKCECFGDDGDEDDMPVEVLGLFWPIILPLAILAGIYYLLVLIGKGMDKIIDNITKNTK